MGRKTEEMRLSSEELNVRFTPFQKLIYLMMLFDLLHVDGTQRDVLARICMVLRSNLLPASYLQSFSSRRELAASYSISANEYRYNKTWRSLVPDAKVASKGCSSDASYATTAFKTGYFSPKRCLEYSLVLSL